MNYQQLNKFIVPSGFRGKPGWFVQLWWITQSLFFKTTPQFMYGWRNFLLRQFGAKIGRNVIIRPSVHIQFPWKVSIGDDSWIGDDVVLYSLGDIEIGSNVVVSQKTYLCTGSHDYKELSFPIYAEKIILEDQCWLATDVFVAPGVTIGKGCVVGARSSVYSNTESGMLYIGNPARLIKSRI